MESMEGLTSKEIQTFVCLCFPVTSFPYLEGEHSACTVLCSSSCHSSTN